MRGRNRGVDPMVLAATIFSTMTIIFIAALGYGSPLKNQFEWAEYAKMYAGYSTGSRGPGRIGTVFLGANGTTISLGEFRGKAIMLIFFTTECPYCREEVAELMKVYRSLSGKVDIVMISTGWERDSLDQIKTFQMQLEIPWLVGLDVNQYHTFLGVKSVPHIFVFDAEGRLLYRHVGEVSGEKLLSLLSNLGV